MYFVFLLSCSFCMSNIEFLRIAGGHHPRFKIALSSIFFSNRALEQFLITSLIYMQILTEKKYMSMQHANSVMTFYLMPIY